MTDRRTFLKQAGILAASLPLGAGLEAQAAPIQAPADKWTGLRHLFDQDPSYIHFSNFLITSHPRPVREAIERHRAAIDRNPGLTMDWDLQEPWKRERQVREWAGRYLQAKPGQIALTGSTTEGLAMMGAAADLSANRVVVGTTRQGMATMWDKQPSRAEPQAPGAEIG